MSDSPSGAARPRTDIGTVVLHWTVVVAMLASLATGFRLSWDGLSSPARPFARWIEGVLPSGEIWTWHFVSAFALLSSALAYWIYMRRASLTARIALRRTRVLATAAPSKAKWNAVNVALHWLAYAMVLVLSATGLLLYLGHGGWVVTVHAVTALVAVAYIVVHVVAHFAYGGLHQILRLFRPSRLSGAAALKRPLLAAGVVAAAATGFLAWADNAGTDVLEIDRVANAPELDPALSAEVWRKAKPVLVHTEQGANLQGGVSDVEVRAVHDGKKVYFAFRWADPTRSLKRLPLVKTAEGWTIRDDDAFDADVHDQYEDKFAVLFTKDGGWGNGHVSHLGPDPLPGSAKPYNGRGYHFTTDGSYAEMLQWKATRGGLVYGMDHQWMGPPKMPSDAEASGAARYQAGYWNHDGTAPYVYNYKAKTAVSGYKGLIDVPFLPKDLAATQAAMRGANGKITLDGAENMDADQRWWMFEEETVPYSKEADDKIPVGTVIPGVILKNHGEYTGDRGAIRAKAAWADGKWTLVASRDVQAKSKYDQEFAPGRELYMFLAVFDHTQTRHTRHMRPVRIAVH